MKYSKGPWKIFKDKNSNTLAIHDHDNNPKNPIVNWGGFDDNGDQSFDEKSANAHLMASSPEMIEALHVTKDMLDEIGGFEEHSDYLNKIIYKALNIPA